MKATVFLITIFVNALIGVLLLFSMLLALNGFSEKQAGPAVIFFVIWVLLYLLISSFVGTVFAGFLNNNKGFRRWSAGLSAIVVFIIVGTFLGIGGFAAAIAIASALR